MERISQCVAIELNTIPEQHVKMNIQILPKRSLSVTALVCAVFML